MLGNQPKRQADWLLFWKSFSILKNNLAAGRWKSNKEVWKIQLIYKWETWKSRHLCLHVQSNPPFVFNTNFICLTALDPTLSATNSTVRRSDGGWLWKKACSRSTCHIKVIGIKYLHTNNSENAISQIFISRWLTCSFCCDLLAVGASLSSAEVGVILRMIPPLLAVLPDTKAARSLRNSPGNKAACYFVSQIYTHVKYTKDTRKRFCGLHPGSTHQEMDSMYK